MQKVLLLILLCFIFSLNGQAQFTRYIIKFKDKGTNPFSLNNPIQYLSQRSLDRRARYNIAIDSSDLPVTPGYIDSLRLAGNVTILNVSKWLNQVAILTVDDVALTKINSFPFVESTSPIAARHFEDYPVNKKLCFDPKYMMKAPISSDAKLVFDPVDGLRIELPENNDASQTGNYTSRTTTDIYDYGQSFAQVKIHNGDFLHNHGFRGDGMQMVILDAGFYHYQTLPTFDSIRNNNQILGTWDFVANEASVDEDYYHGMQCLSTIAANLPGTFIGTAPKTSFYLFRTEDVGSEYPIEEQNWAAGIERADSLGADISSTSLGYSQFDNALLNHTYADMDGNTTIIARAADMAAKKGILVVAAAGNEGNSTWHFITTPSDADSTLCVGAVDVSGNSAGFSSYGPSSDGQIKPSVAAVGLNAVVANTTNGQPSYNSGTSFACPNMAGITTCLWQAFPEINNMGIIGALELSGNRSDNPDDRTGYGIPDAKKAFVILLKKLYTQQSTIEDCSAFLQFSLKTDNTMLINVERKVIGETDYTSLPGTLQNNESYGMHHFTFSDAISNLSLGNIQYRLKVTIATDTVFYLDTININYTQSCQSVTNNSIAIGPNPFLNSFNIIIGRVLDSKIEVVVHNAAGQRIYRNRFQQPAGRQTWTIPMQTMNCGAYFVTVYIDGKKEITKKIVKL
ncbi:MAG: S8 family serine peptidase [Ferruginibacter sp.]